MAGTILIVEDDPDILSSLAELIRHEGYAVATAVNGQQALERLATQRPDLIFLDLMMPVMDGWTFLREMRTRFPDAQIPVVLLSAKRGLREDAIRLGVDHFLEKPFELDEIIRLARQLMAA
jgi:CheY-like chemotaxis protein